MESLVNIKMEDRTREKLLKAGVNIETAIERFLGNEGMFVNFLKKFAKDPSFELLKTAMEGKQYEDAFKAAHSLKGLCGNLSIDGLFQIVSREVEFLRNGKYDEACELLPEVVKEYERVTELLNTI